VDAKFTVQVDKTSKKLDLLQKHRMPRLNYDHAYDAKNTQKTYVSMKDLSVKHDYFKYFFIMKGILCVPSW